MIKQLFFACILLSTNCFAQLDSLGYKLYLKEIMKVESIKNIFPDDTIFNQEKYITYLKTLPNTLKIYYDEGNEVHVLDDKEGYENYVGIKLSRLSKKRYFEITFYDENGYLKGPDWWFYNNGNIKIKRTWNQNRILKGDIFGAINEKFYYQQKFYRNGNLKNEGLYDENKKSGEWKYYNRKGVLKKIRNF